MFKCKRELAARGMPTAEEFALWGARELSFEELLSVNGGRNVKDDPNTDRISEVIPSSEQSSSSEGSTESGGSSGGSSGTNDSTPPASSSPSEPVTGSDSDNIADDAVGYTDYPEAGYIDYPGSGYTDGYESGGSSNGSSGSSDNYSSDSGNADSGSSDDSWGGSSDNDSSDSGGSYTGGSYTGGGYTYTPPVQNQEPRAPDSPGAQGQELPNTGGMPSVPQKPDQAKNNKTNMNPIFPKDIFNKPRKNLAPLRGIAPEYRPLWPTESRRITSEFGPRHREGIDVGALKQGKKGDPIKASMGGTVTVSRVPDWSGSKSTYVVVHGDDGKGYRYVHLDIYPGIFEGSRVNQGELIGFMSDNGAPGQVHLHFEVWEAGKPINPTTILP